MRDRAGKLTLALTSTLLSLCVAECGLRLFAPRYAEPASAVFVQDSARLVRRVPNARGTRTHPDSGKTHSVIHNGLAMRQHRAISAEPAAGEVRIGLFGDSFTENTLLPVAYSFSEVLDYLVTRQYDRATVLNFGVNGYGMGQSYVSYLQSPAALRLDQVMYVFCGNDIVNLYENQIFGFNDEGKLVILGAPPRPWWIPLASRIALSYVLLDARNWMRGADWGELEITPLSERVTELAVSAERRLRTRDETSQLIRRNVVDETQSENMAHYLGLARVIVDHWAQEAARRGDNFRVVLLPRRREARLAGHFAAHRVVNLYEEFGAYGLSDEPWIFANDGHWNELGNLLAAVHLYRAVAAELPGEVLNEQEISRAVYTYYRAFGGWRPSMWSEPWEVPAAELAAIQQRYLELE